MPKLTARGVAALTKPGRYGDGGGLFLQVGSKGQKSWLFIYQALHPTNVGGVVRVRAREMGLGSAKDVSLVEAREKVEEYRRLRRQGIDPIAHRKASKAPPPPVVPTFKQFAEQWLVENETHWKAGSKGLPQWRSSLRAYAYPVIGGLELDKITTKHVKKVLDPIWVEKNETARKTRMRIRRILDAARALGHRTGDNPADWRGNLKEVLPYQPRDPVSHAALDYRQIPAFMAELRKRPGVAARAFEFLILTATRTSETLGARLTEIEGKVWKIPRGRMKTGRPRGRRKPRGHNVPLSDRALAILAELPREPGNPFIFIGAGHRKPLSSMAFAMLLRRMQVPVTPHGFRSSFRTWTAETTNVPNHVAEMALAHAIPDAVEAAYQRGELFEKRRVLMDEWAAYCAG